MIARICHLVEKERVSLKHLNPLAEKILPGVVQGDAALRYNYSAEVHAERQLPSFEEFRCFPASFHPHGICARLYRLTRAIVYNTWLRI